MYTYSKRKIKIHETNTDKCEGEINFCTLNITYSVINLNKAKVSEEIAIKNIISQLEVINIHGTLQ